MLNLSIGKSSSTRRSPHRLLLFLFLTFILFSIISAKGSKARLRTRLHEKSRKILGVDVGKKQFGTWQNEAVMGGNLNQVGDEDEMEVIDDNEPPDPDEEYEEYLEEDETEVLEGEEISNEVHPPSAVTPARLVPFQSFHIIAPVF